MNTVTVIEFARQSGPYRTGDQAAFPPERAQAYIKAGVASLVHERVPVVAPAVAAADARRLAEAHNTAPASGSAQPMAAQAGMQAQIDALQAQMAELLARLGPVQKNAKVA